MVDQKSFCEIALSFPEVIEAPHFGIPSFRVNKKIFTTLWEKENKVMLKLPLNDQSVFCSFDSKIIYPVPGGWGKQGATFFELSKVKKSMLKDALTIAYCNVAPKRLAEKFSK